MSFHRSLPGRSCCPQSCRPPRIVCHGSLSGRTGAVAFTDDELLLRRCVYTGECEPIGMLLAYNEIFGLYEPEHRAPQYYVSFHRSLPCHSCCPQSCPPPGECAVIAYRVAPSRRRSQTASCCCGVALARVGTSPAATWRCDWPFCLQQEERNKKQAIK